VQTVSVKLESEQIKWLNQQAANRRRSRAAVLRDLIDQRRTHRGPTSLHERTADLCGSLDGPANLSTRKLKGYGRD
jgi:hypothetical protein